MANHPAKDETILFGSLLFLSFLIVPKGKHLLDNLSFQKRIQNKRVEFRCESPYVLPRKDVLKPPITITPY